MLPLVWLGRRDLLKHIQSEWKQSLILGALGMWICGAFVYIAGQTTTAANISLIYAAAPIGIAVASSFMLGQELSLRRKFALVCALTGVLFIVSKGHLDSLLNVRFVAGDIWVSMATVAWIAYTILQQRWKTKLLPVQRLFCITAGGLIVLLPFVLWEVQTQTLTWMSGMTIGIVVAAGIFPGFLSYLVYAHIVQQLGASRAGLVLYLGPVYTAVIGWLFLNEAPQWFHFVGALLVLPSIYFARSTATD
jgi:drug/metabolite transporter (DMT)-like permease